ncbi:MAG TPA: DUF4337 family protein [Candidatus Binataceae bacterium]|nr:DUF4337 family protein [Candidatus Binataceae bacterium]
MPEEPEVENAELRDELEEERESEREGRGLLRAIALTTALFAALAAVSALMAGGSINEALVLKAESNQLQNQASDLWTDYQAKGIKAAIQASTAAIWAAAGKAAPPELAAEQSRYAAEQKAIAEDAKQKEAERDRKSEEATHLLHQHHRFANSVALFQVAIALAAIAALTKTRLIWLISVVVGLGGGGLFLTTFL